MTTSLPLFARAQYVLHFTDLLRQIGAPVDRELARAKLPTYLEEMPNAYISEDFAYRFLMRCSAQEGIDDLGFEAGWGFHLEDLGPEMLNAMKSKSTVKERIKTFNRFAQLEANSLQCMLVPEGNAVRVCIHELYPQDVDIRISEWQSIKIFIEIIRSGIGTDWLPSEISLRSSRKVCLSVLDRLNVPNVLVGQPTTSFLVPASLLVALVKPCGIADTSVVNQLSAEPTCDSLVGTLQMLLKPYLLSSSYPSIDLAAEIAGISSRTLQRLLKQHQVTYTDLIENMRFDLAAHMLADSDQNIIDIALQLGYEHTPNFSRAFKRIFGVTPMQFRKDNLLAI